MVVGAVCLDETDLVLLGSGVATVVGPPEMPPFILLDHFGLVIVGLLGVCCEDAKIGASDSCPSAMIPAMMSSRYFTSVSLRMTLAATASSSASIGSASSSEACGVVTFSLHILKIIRI